MWDSSSRPSCARAAMVWGWSSRPPPLALGVGFLLPAATPGLGLKDWGKLSEENGFLGIINVSSVCSIIVHFRLQNSQLLELEEWKNQEKEVNDKTAETILIGLTALFLFFSYAFLSLMTEFFNSIASEHKYSHLDLRSANLFECDVDLLESIV